MLKGRLGVCWMQERKAGRRVRDVEKGGGWGGVALDAEGEAKGFWVLRREAGGHWI